MRSLHVWTIIFIDNGTETSDIKEIQLQEKADWITHLAFVQHKKWMNGGEIVHESDSSSLWGETFDTVNLPASH